MNNLEMMRKRFEFQGGVRQEDRMIKDKWRTFQQALKYSYQACSIELVQKNSEVLAVDATKHDCKRNIPEVRALINPDKVKQDYDDKILSIDYQAGLEPGDVFEWKKTDTYWLIYLQEITEDAYFRGEIRRCRYQINFLDEDGNAYTTWAAIRGPVETQIDSIQKNQVRIDKPNLSLNILLPRNEKTLFAFDRYREFIFAGKCWRVEAPDTISMKNIIEVNAEEYYVDRDNDDLETEIKNGLLIKPVDPTPESEIKGNTFIKPKIAEIYTSEEEGEWNVDKNTPVSIYPIDGHSVKIIWNKSTHGQFTLYQTSGDKVLEKVIVVESLF